MFAGTLSRGEYARAAGTRLALFISGTLAIPAAMVAVNQAQYCPADLCGPLSAAVIMFIAMPVLYFGLMISLIGITARRLRDIGLTSALAALLPILMFGDLLVGLSLDGFVFDAYVDGAVHPIPGDLLTALACIGFLCVARSESESGDDFAQRWGMVGALAFGVVVLASVFALLKLASEISMAVGGVWSSHAFVYGILYAGALIAPIPVVVLLALVACRERRPHAA